MSSPSTPRIAKRSPDKEWLINYYGLRFLVAALWAVGARSVAEQSPTLSAIMLTAYPAWDAIANWMDAVRSGGLAANKSQTLNAFVSGVTAVSVLIATRINASAVLVVFGLWAFWAGLFQLASALRRWKRIGAQWAMILSGAQSALAGAIFVKQAAGPHADPLQIASGYAAFGAFYFLVSCIWLVATQRRASKPINV